MDLSLENWFGPFFWLGKQETYYERITSIVSLRNSTMLQGIPPCSIGAQSKAKQMTGIMDSSPDSPERAEKKSSVPDFHHVDVHLKHVCLDGRYIGLHTNRSCYFNLCGNLATPYKSGCFEDVLCKICVFWQKNLDRRQGQQRGRDRQGAHVENYPPGN